MTKTALSVVLKDEVIQAIDHIAQVNNTSRSNMINIILSQYARLGSSQEEIEQIFSSLRTLINEQSFYKCIDTENEQKNVFIIKSEISFKYNPTLNYRIELVPNNGTDWGKIRFLLRSKNATLIYYLNDFFDIWQKVEYSNAVGAQRKYLTGKSCLARDLVFPKQQATPQQLAKALMDYIILFDTAFKQYITYPKNSINAQQYVDEVYSEGIKNTMLTKI